MIVFQRFLHLMRIKTVDAAQGAPGALVAHGGLA